jgi:hypothetical protein
MTCVVKLHCQVSIMLSMYTTTYLELGPNFGSLLGSDDGSLAREDYCGLWRLYDGGTAGRQNVERETVKGSIVGSLRSPRLSRHVHVFSSYVFVDRGFCILRGSCMARCCVWTGSVFVRLQYQHISNGSTELWSRIMMR